MKMCLVLQSALTLLRFNIRIWKNILMLPISSSENDLAIFFFFLDLLIVFYSLHVFLLLHFCIDPREIDTEIQNDQISCVD